MSKIDELRGEIRALEQQVAELARAKLPPAEVAKAVTAWLDDQADRHSLTPFGELVTAGGLQTALPLDPVRLLLGLFRSEIQERLTAHLAEINPSPGLPAARRQKEIGALIEQRRQLERAEEREILRMEDAGEEVARRPDADAELLADVWHEFLGDDGRLRAVEAAA